MALTTAGLTVPHSPRPARARPRIAPAALLCGICLALTLSACGYALADLPEVRSGQVIIAKYVLDAQRSGRDTVLIPAAIYLADSTLDLSAVSSLCIFFEPGSSLLLDDPWRDVVRIGACSEVTIQGCHFSHLVPFEDYQCHGAVFCIEGSRDVRLIDCEICGCGAMGLVLDRCSDVAIRNCLVENNSHSAFFVVDVDGLEIIDCIIRNNHYLFWSSIPGRITDLLMTGNLVSGNAPGYYDREQHVPGPLQH